ncbi:hypothetical protein [Marilutibacter maris]|uniref:hypothetical protein n=1 Tax=Marilutibacter maris TaxID=1605891 RepID=UPI0011AE77E1|nr:hypothetical protein [Lysobacter maris]
MPDMGFPHHGLPRDRDNGRRPPPDWSQALSSLPLDTPDSDGWARLAACLPVAGADTAPPAPRSAPGPGPHTRARQHRRRVAGLAAAAVLAAVVAMPLLRTGPSAPDPVRTPPPHTGSVAADPTSASAMADEPVTGPRHAQAATAAATTPAVAATDPSATDDARTADRRPGDTDAAAPTSTASTPMPTAPDRAPTIAPAPQPDGTRVAVADRRPLSDAATATATTAAPSATDMDADDDVARLEAESARLEALIAIARDDNVGSAAATVLTASLDERIGRIDGALSQPGLDRDSRLRLWRSRVDALHELAGVETTQRWLSARGESWDAALVQVD